MVLIPEDFFAFFLIKNMMNSYHLISILLYARLLFPILWNMGLQFPPSHKLACASSLVGELPLPLRMPPFFFAE